MYLKKYHLMTLAGKILTYFQATRIIALLLESFSKKVFFIFIN